ncbi:PhoH family protein [Candidatus Xianfuyuplasma coldseepsis]|uniref:PhoH-like protein n=1 Tax=Candidatus Xianfuyuplasma coldseepsis TaxID=2782163 RepID=A0A7L7KTT0_9MOLU|nr:phosphate starvation-inducible protein PhoH [Xianfuyuplasma coldseepsis]
MVIGNQDRNISVLGSMYNIKIFSKGEDIYIDTNDEAMVDKMNQIFFVLMKIVNHNVVISERDIIYIAKLMEQMSADDIFELYTNRLLITKTVSGRPIYAKTLNQRHYIQAIKKNDLVFGIGPAGTGKTYVAVMNAISRLKDGSVKKLILTRPAVEAGENLGFLPGDLKEKIDPYLRPLYDALYEALGTKQTEEMIEKGIIEIAPLAYMRGRTLENAYVILDEAQNTTTNQMKLFLTRMGFNSKMVVTGDITQIDLPKKTNSGLVQAIHLLEAVDGIEIITFERVDVIRHPLVQKVLERYENYENKYRKLF